MNENRNLLLAVLLSAAVLFGWQYFVARPQMEAERQHQAALSHQEKKQTQLGTATAPNAPPRAAELSREAALKQSGVRVAIDTPSVDGSILLKGARFDDLRLKRYHDTISDKSPEIVLLTPENTKYPYFTQFGWVAQPGSKVRVPGFDSDWKLVDGRVVSPGKSVTLEWDNGQGLVFSRKIAVDDQYMFTVSDSVRSDGAAKATLYPYASVVREGIPKEQHYWVLHEGFVGVADGSARYTKYDGLKPGETQSFGSTGGWVGITDKYWMAAAIPSQQEKFDGNYKVTGDDTLKKYQSDYLLGARTVAPGKEAQVTQHLFAGAKVVSTISDYEDKLGIVQFNRAIDWGWFFFLTKPFFLLIDWLYRLVGNFGVAILLFTVAIKLLFFPLADASYRSMSRMKKLQPEMEKLKERFGDDKVRQQQEMMELYKREKVNPVSGCLPMLLQIPVFFSLYKVLFVTIEMRHAPFFGWIQDLSAPDPSSLINFFGLLPFNPHDFLPSFLAFLSVGIWPIVMGASQWVTMKLNPAPTDPVQARMFSYMPIIFTFMLATFPAGLVIYWTWNNILSGIQQYVMMRRQGVEIHLFNNLKLPSFLSGREKKPAPGE
ncbi:MAG: membrane protein insertase YidC [Proteobacteria bacterium]|nr:membrane protein insertase YidC [Pseudomonadota bacterium]